MSAAATTEHGLSDEMLAAFVDGRLTETERAAVVKHLATCDDCRTRLIKTREILDELSAEGNVVEFRDKKNRWKWIAGPIAAALVIAVVLAPVSPPVRRVLDRSFGRIGDFTMAAYHAGKDWTTKTWTRVRTGQPSRPTQLLAEASDKLEYRRTYGRLSGGFLYKPMERVMRGAEEPLLVEELPLLEAQGKLQNAPHRDDHAISVGLLLLKQRDNAVKGLEKVLARNPPNRDAVAQDLAVALLQRGAAGDNERSLQISNGLWARAPTSEIAWNRAYALQNLGQDKEAIAAWNDYLKLDRNSEWAKEATDQRDRLQADLQQP